MNSAQIRRDIMSNNINSSQLESKDWVFLKAIEVIKKKDNKKSHLLPATCYLLPVFYFLFFYVFTT